jgi:RNA polymerase sigma-70 factor (ECF subfamily)
MPSSLGPVPPGPRSARRLDDASAAWLRDLAPAAAEREQAVSRLHAMLLRAARAELQRRAGSDVTGRELDDLAHQAAADSLMAVLAKLESFRGESRFTTWAYRFVILEVATKLGRHFWRIPRASLADEDWEQLPSRFGLDPQRRAEWHDLVAAIRDAVENDLTPHQRRVFSEIVLRGIPLDALVAKLGSNRNAIYKTMFDARRRLRHALAANGYVRADLVEIT